MLHIPAMGHRRIDFIEPAEAAGRLLSLGGLAFLDSALPHSGLGRYAYVAAAPFADFTVDAEGARFAGERLAGPPLDALRAVMARFPLVPSAGLPPFQGGAIGVVGYDFAHHLERLARPSDFDPAEPSLRLNFYDTILAVDLAEKTAMILSSGHPETGTEARRERAERQTEAFLAALAKPREDTGITIPATRLDWSSNFTAEGYEAAIGRVREYILAGDIYQANIAQQFTASLPENFDAFAFYERLRAANPAPFAAYLEFPGLTVASSSPERFLKLAGAAVETRPIKGTAPRSADPDEDRALAGALLASEKDRAENVMIVDLLRNDLARVATPDSVEVPVLCGLETYASVHHLVSVVTATLREGMDGLDLIAAAFPGGSITGAPKLRAMDIITEIEDRARGVYCGSIGYLGFDGSLDLNIAIRTVTLQNGRATLQAGGGITILSEPAAEYAETFAKASRVFAAFEDTP
ncbi:aminodeoxychorismate synthase, component I [Aureimonas sp. SA4125]|uniref:aminodeoxychorismate synthase component I n=1 Tax=Aureimonas sp. SA4125 TaxID=2826993 RepID=UPI001CC44182|nr:aminodeoxychorismate synthase component I [Aureimonas sp. SA4125]BDA82613.1 aminodeoxychorismate synthase, component I [Aureimonas sp. SA4125]